MVGQHRLQLGLVLQQGVKVGFWNLCEGLIGRRKDRERPLALERGHQIGCLERHDQRLEIAGGHGGVHDVLGLCGKSRAGEGGRD